ncbi:L-lactate MFS transporter [Formosa sp. S-31]|uniref:L-lactate MFS transporter n=1 Tax=Formosa sp. S-31 TaxID=2790949 RepID=UPI003EBDF64F
MSTNKLKNRWLIAASAIGIHISIGSIYAYSVMTNPVKEVFGVEGSDIKWAFKLAILFLGLTTTFLGKWVERVGPRKSGITAGLCYGLGIFGAGLAAQFNSLPLFYIFYGVIGGVGLGLGYIAPVSTLVKWFPDRKGLATGMAIMGFGFSALIFGPFMQTLFEHLGVAPTFYTLGALYAVIIVLSSLYLQAPPEGYLPDGYVPPKQEEQHAVATEISSSEAIKSKKFWYLWTMMFINISCGIALIAAASPMMQEMLNYTPLEAAAIVGFIGIFNGLGRLIWSTLSDYLGRDNTFIVFFLIQIVAFYMLPKIGMEWLFLSVLFLVISMYGGGYAVLPAFVGDLFGTKSLGVINGRVLSAWAVAGVVGPTVYDWVKDRTGSLDSTLMVFSVFFVVALIISILMKVSISKSKKPSVITEGTPLKTLKV